MRFFVYNKDMKPQEQQSNTRKGIFVSVVGMALNLLLACSKIAVGIVTGFVSVIADGVNNLSDCGGGVVSIVSFRIADKPADKEHPYGHQRVEYVASLLISFIILTLAVQLMRESLETILSGVLSSSSLLVFVLLGSSIAVKAFMFLYYRMAYRKIHSDTLKAASVDSACDCFATSAVVIGLIVSRYTGFAADGWAGIFVSLFIVWEGVGILREAGSKLLGQAPDKTLFEAIRKYILADEAVLGLHDLHIYTYGTNNMFATAHIEMDASVPSMTAHETLDRIECEILKEYGVELTAHLDPVDQSDEEARELEQRVRAAVEGMVEGMNLHDFRIVRGATTRAVFEVGVPFSCKTKDKDLKCDIARTVRILGDYEPVVTIERE